MLSIVAPFNGQIDLEIFLVRFILFLPFVFMFSGVQSTILACLLEYVLPNKTNRKLAYVLFGFLYGFFSAIWLNLFSDENFMVVALLSAVSGALTCLLYFYFYHDLVNFNISIFKDFKVSPILFSIVAGIVTLAVINPGTEAGVIFTGPIYLFAFSLPWYIAIKAGVYSYRKFITYKNNA